MLLKSCLLAAALAAPAAAQVDARRQAERALFEKVIEIPTVQGRAGQMARLTALLTAEFRKAGITNVVVKNHDDTQSLVARWPAAKPSGRKPILLMAHMDVVEANPADWKHDPFTFREENGYYLGRGTSDNKGDLVGIVLALQNLKRSGFEPSRDIIVLFTGDEETTGNGARRAASEWRSLIDAEYALNGDAGGGSLYQDGRVESFAVQIAEKTYADYKLTAVNRGGHSSSPASGQRHLRLGRRAEGDRGASFPADDQRRHPRRLRAHRRRGQGPLRRAGPQVAEGPDRPGNRRSTGGQQPRLHQDTLRRDDAVGRPCPQCPAAESGSQCQLPHISRSEDRGGTTAAPDAVRPGREGRARPLALARIRSQSRFAPTSSRPIERRWRPAFKEAPIIPMMSAGATDGSFIRNAGIPVYGVGGMWGILGEHSGAHGLDERVLIEGFHGQVPIWEELLRRLAG